MSVAFRRESDEEHLEPRFERPLPSGPNPVTARGLALIQAQVAALDATLAAAGDDEARKRIRADLRYWTNRAGSAALVVETPDTVTVAFGSRVTIERGGVASTIDIVGHDEADPAAGRIAFGAPLARALIGAEVGETIDFAGGWIAIVATAPIPD